jgi:D-alanyl-lipoteichoic acid acyltransferase DltB (MBOAT superfamily)
MAAFLSDIAGRKIAFPKFINYFVYVALPFKLLAGPIEFPRMIQKIESMKFKFSMSRAMVGYSWLILGLFMKFVIANRLNPSLNLKNLELWHTFFTAIIFEFKFYFDFAGYSFMAYGAALMFNFRLTLNFTHPFLSKNVVLFWRNWHISLGKFLSRYVLETNLKYLKNREVKLVFASVIFMFSALWHGGTMNYLFWGIFHGLCYYIYVRLLKNVNVNVVIAIIAMFLFIVAGRYLAIDSDAGRLLLKLSEYGDYRNYLAVFNEADLIKHCLEMISFKMLILIVLFLSFEYINIKKYGPHKPYHFFRKSFVMMSMTVIVMAYGFNTSSLLYARL